MVHLTKISENYFKRPQRLCMVLLENDNLAVDCTLDMFDKIVKRVMLYRCKVWGYNQSILIEKLHFKLQITLKLHLKYTLHFTLKLHFKLLKLHFVNIF